MPRLSLWKPEKADDYRFLDRTIDEMYQVGGTDLYVHKYLGTNNPVGSTDSTQPHYDITSPTNIQDLLFLENRDRNYDPNIYRIRGHYNVQNLDFDLSQFGLFLTNDIIFVTVHYNKMIDLFGRKLMVGDVFELPHLTDYHPLNETIPIGLRRYYQITDANFASEGFSQTWYPHLWRIKAEPLVNSQEFQDILEEPLNKDNYLGDWDPNQSYEPGYTVDYGGQLYEPIRPVPPGIPPTDTSYWKPSLEPTLGGVVSTYNRNLAINDAALREAKKLLPKSGYDVSTLYVVPTFENNEPAPPKDLIIANGAPTITVGTVTYVTNPLYQSSSPAIRINRDKVPSMRYMGKFNSISLSSAIMAPALTDSGSGPVEGTTVVTATNIGSPVTGPYGTADNTYSTADQYIDFIATALDTKPMVTVIPLLEVPNDMNPQILIRAIVFSENGSATNIFPEGTRVLSVDRINKRITVSHATRGAIPAGTPLEMSYDFTGTVTKEMDYRADCDPRFQFIRRSTPRSFGYLAGYMTGDGQAPNGEPAGAGIAFPANPQKGDYFLRLDYLPQKLFRWNGAMWVEISRNVRTPSGFELDDQSQLSTYINEKGQTTTAQGGTVPTRQSLSQALRIQPD